jgi:hypothetical protein
VRISWAAAGSPDKTATPASSISTRNRTANPASGASGPSTRRGTTSGGTAGKKFYDYQAWLRYLIDHFFNSWEVGLTGVVRWRGESPGDKGSIVVANNKVDVRAGEKVRLTHGTVFKNTTVLGWRNRPARA